MTQKLEPDWLAWPQTKALVAAFSSHAGSLRFVGGAVRDALLGRTVKDVDAATTLSPETVMQLLAQAELQAIPTGIKHGTVTARVESHTFEITTLRSDTACDGRHAEVAFTTDWKEDAARRDFTMNALYLSPEGELFDYYGGQEDAKAGLVRFIGNAPDRVREDYLRILRFYRFYAHYGQGAPDAASLAACEAGAEKLSHISGERIQAELLKLLAAPRPSATLARMREGGVLLHALGMGVADMPLFERLEEMEALGMPVLPAEAKLSGFVLLSQGMPERMASQLARKLRLAARIEKSWQQWLPYLGQIDTSLTVADQKHVLRQLGAAPYTTLVMMAWAMSEDDVYARSPYVKMLKLAADWQPPLFPVNGADLMAAGIPPGRVMGDVLRQLQDVWERSDYRMNKDELLSRATDLA